MSDSAMRVLIGIERWDDRVRQVAQRTAEVLAEHDLDATVAEVDEIHDLQGCDGVILGSAGRTGEGTMAARHSTKPRAPS